jgi:hypothetical protein
MELEEGEAPDDDVLESSARTLIHCKDLVTPGVLAVRALLRPRILLIRADWCVTIFDGSNRIGY